MATQNDNTRHQGRVFASEVTLRGVRPPRGDLCDTPRCKGAWLEDHRSSWGSDSKTVLICVELLNSE